MLDELRWHSAGTRNDQEGLATCRARLARLKTSALGRTAGTQGEGLRVRFPSLAARTRVRVALGPTLHPRFASESSARSVNLPRRERALLVIVPAIDRDLGVQSRLIITAIPSQSLRAAQHQRMRCSPEPDLHQPMTNSSAEPPACRTRAGNYGYRGSCGSVGMYSQQLADPAWGCFLQSHQVHQTHQTALTASPARRDDSERGLLRRRCPRRAWCRRSLP